MTALTTPAPTVIGPNRDHYGRPLIVPPEGGKPIPYTRVTTLAKTIEEQSALAAWKQRMTLLGVIAQPHLTLTAAAHRDDKKKLNEICEQALAAAQAGAKAEIGTAIHRITEKIDLDQDPGAYPSEYASTVNAYRQATAGMRMRAVEQFIVLDDLQVAGTADRIVEIDGVRYVADTKTGSIEYSSLGIAQQIACYANGVGYDVATGARTPLDVSTDWGIVIHLPAGQGTCTLYQVDLRTGWDAALCSMAVRDWRKRRGVMSPMPVPAQRAPLAPAGSVEDAIASAATAAELVGVWEQHQASWTAEHTSLAAARKALIAAGLNGAQAPA